MKKLVLAITLLSLSFLTYSQGYWEEVQDVDPFGTLNKCIFTDSDNGWAVGEEGIIQHTSDGGLNWELQYNNPDKMFESGHFINQNEGWLIGWSNILHTDDGGQNWESQTLPQILGSLNDVFFLDENNGWIVGWYEIILKTIDGGETWEKISNDISHQIVYNSVKFFDENNGVLCGTIGNNEAGIIMITNDGGLTWTESGSTTISNFLSLDINDNGEAFVCGSNGGIFKSEDMGITWLDKSYGDKYFYDIELGEDQKAYIIGRYNIYKSTDNCETWNVYNNVPYGLSMRDIEVCGEQLFGCGLNTAVYKINEESDFETLLYNQPLTFNKIEFLNANEGFAIRGSSIYTSSSFKTNDGGYSWIEDTSIPEQNFCYLQSLNQSLFYISTSNKLVKSSDGGQTWETTDLPVDLNYYYNNFFSVPSENTLYLCNRSSSLYKSNDGGYNWDEIIITEATRFSICYFYNDNFGWLVDDFTGFLWRTTDGGISWDSMKVDPTHTYIPSEIYFIDENVGFVVTEIGYVYRTTDGGDTFEQVFEMDSYTWPIFHFVNESTGYLINKKDIYKTEDRGLNWTEYQTISSGIRCAAFTSTKSWIAGMQELMAINDDLMDVNNNLSFDMSINVFLNPSNGIVSISLQEISSKNANLSVFDINGRLIKSIELNDKYSMIELSELTKGIYFINISNGLLNGTKKLIIY